MNNRQKAKHFKQLYERMLKKPIPVVIETQSLDHLRVCKAVSKNLLCDAVKYPELFVTDVENSLLKEMNKALRDRIIVEENIKINSYVYSLDVWVRER